MYVCGFVHATNGPPSRLHSYVTGLSFALKENVALEEPDTVGGPVTIVVSGGVVSDTTVNVLVLLVTETTPWNVA